MSIAKWSYKRGLHDLGNGTWAYLQPDGSWGWSNAGLVTDGDESLVVDTLFDLKLTREMLLAMRSAPPGPPPQSICWSTLIPTATTATAMNS